MRRTLCITRALLVGALLTVGGAGAVSAQQEGGAPFRPDSISIPITISPGGAFIRSMLIPGWGQAAVGSYGRGSFYFVTEAVSVWMLLKTASRRSTARDGLEFQRAEAERHLRAQGMTNPDSIALLVSEDPAVLGAENLVDTRSQQFEDWAAFGLFMLLVGGADAFVSAHLSDFPVPLEVDLQGTPEHGVEVKFSLPLGGGGW